jgi:hypothetical protein
VPSWVSVPTSVALPFGTFETVLSDKINKVGIYQQLNISLASASYWLDCFLELLTEQYYALLIFQTIQ